jgi:hypothetical protein
LPRWHSAVGKIDDLVADFARMATAIEPLGGDRWKVLFPPGATKPVEYCQQPNRKSLLEDALKKEMGRAVVLEFAALPGEAAPQESPKPQASLRAQKMRELSEHPYVKKLCEVLDGEIIRVDPPRKEPPQENLKKPHSQPTN